MAPLEAFPAADQQMTRQAHADLQQKLNVLEEVRADLEAEGIKVPGIVVCGDQSAGESGFFRSGVARDADQSDTYAKIGPCFCRQELGA
jgi:hypothetical protein